MTVTVRRLARTTELGLELVAGHDGADRAIEWAHSIELTDPSPWITGGELVMTTGLTIGASDEEQFAYVSRLVRADAAALAFDTGTTFDRVPDGVRAAGDALGFPILAVPRRTPFIAITRAVIDELTADRLRAVQRVVDQQEKLARETLRGGIPGLISTLGRALSSTAVLIGADGELLSLHGTHPGRVLGHARTVARAAGSTPGRPRRIGAGVSDHDGHTIVHSVGVAGETAGYLAIGSPHELGTEDRLLVAHAAALISIEMAKPAKLADAEQRLRSSVTEALLAMGADLDASVLRYFGFTGDSTVVAVVVTNVGPLLPAQREVALALAAQSVPYLLAPLEGDLVIILGDDRSADWVAALVGTVAAALGRSVRAGRAGPIDIASAATAVRQAAAAAAIEAPAPSAVTDFADAGALSLLLGGRSADELSTLASAVIGPLADHDALAPPSARLLPVLRGWLRHNGQVESAATELGVHRHTMRHRIAKVADVLGRDLDSAEVRAELWVALKAHDLALTLRGE